MHADELLLHDIDGLGPWARAFGEALARLREHGEATLPVVEGLSWQETARWFYRAALAATPGGWWPCLRWDAAHEPGEEAWWGAARGGWVCTDAPAEAWPVALRDEVAAGRACVVRFDGAMELGAALAREVEDMGEVHAVATDPDLEVVRARMLAQHAGGAAVYVSGELGVGKRALVSWMRMRARSPGGRFVFDLDTCADDVLTSLEAELERRAAPPTPFRSRLGRATPRPRAPELDRIKGDSPELNASLTALVKLAPSRLGVLITGEPGTGKELLARALHDLSGRPGPFVALDLGATPEELAESTLFGHVKGAFTGAHADREGAFRAAHGGTLFLDEVGNASPALQVKLLRALQERAVTPVGADRARPVDVRVVAATNADLDAMARRGAFRPDLLSRLKVACVHAPPLRERMEDLDALARAFLGHHDDSPWCTPAACRLLEAYHWPGNVRELENTLEVARVMSGGAPPDVEHLGDILRASRHGEVLCVTRSIPAGAPTPERFGPRTRQMLRVQELSVAPVRERSERSRGALVAEVLGGRPCTHGAWRALTRHAWWGNGVEARGLQDTLAALPPGALTREALGRAAPRLLGDHTLEPVVVMLGPVETRGAVSGLTWSSDAGAVVLGRVPDEGELRENAAGGDPRAARALSFLRNHTHGARADFVALPFLPRLSRMSTLLTRRGDGLHVRAFPGLGLAASVMALGAEEWTPLDVEGEPVGRAGALRFASKRTGETYVQMYVFEGEGALRRHGEEVLELHEHEREVVSTMLGTATERPAPRRAEPVKRRLFAWQLDQAECEALTDIIDSFEGGSIGAHIARCLDAAEGEGVGSTRLRRYLRDAPRASQYLSRLYEHDANDALREMLRARASARGEGATRWLEELPSGVRRALEG
jgi:DNA-binding NtrC family response regulator